MAVSGKTAAPFEIPYFLGTDKPPDVGTVTKAMAERVHKLEEEAAAARQASGVAGRYVGTAEVTRTSAAYGSFSTPVRVTLPKVLKGQLVEILLAGFAKASIKSESLAVGAAFKLLVGGVETEPRALTNEEGEVAANQYRQMWSQNNSFGLKFSSLGSQEFANRSPYTGYFGAGMLLTPPERLLLGVVGEDTTNFIVELLTKSSSGTVTAKNVMLLARAWG